MSVIAYSKSKDGGIQLSENFRVYEFACKDGSDKILIDTKLVTLLQFIRNHFKRSVILNSAYRTPEYNKRVGGASASYHCKGMAGDFNVSGYSPSQVRKIIESGIIPGVDPHSIGLGSYSGFTHIDSRGYKARW